MPRNNFGLSVDDILRLDDKALNQVVGMKRLAPYREDTTKLRPNYKALEMIKGEAGEWRAARCYGHVTFDSVDTVFMHIVWLAQILAIVCCFSFSTDTGRAYARRYSQPIMITRNVSQLHYNRLACMMRSIEHYAMSALDSPQLILSSTSVSTRSASGRRTSKGGGARVVAMVRLQVWVQEAPQLLVRRALVNGSRPVAG